MCFMAWISYPATKFPKHILIPGRKLRRPFLHTRGLTPLCGPMQEQSATEQSAAKVTEFVVLNSPAAVGLRYSQYVTQHNHLPLRNNRRTAKTELGRISQTNAGNRRERWDQDIGVAAPDLKPESVYAG